MRIRSLAATAALVATGLALPGTQPATADVAVKTANMSHIANLQYQLREYTQGTAFGYSQTGRQGGTDLEVTKITVDRGNGPEERDFAVAGSYRNGLHLVDVTDPENPVEVNTYDCGIAQGDVQIFKRDGKTYAAYAQDDIEGDALYTSKCFQEGFALLGVNTPTTPADADTIPERFGTFIIDISNPYATSGPEAPHLVGWARTKTGSHNTTVDPSGRWLLNSNQDLIPKTPLGTKGVYRIEVFDLADLTNPVKVQDIPLSTGAGPHDITFNADSTRAYVAAVSHTVVIDTSTPAQSKVIGVVEDPAISIHHQADPITIGDRTYLVVSDELAGVIQGLSACPGGGLHIYDITGPLENAPVKVGFFGIPQLAPSTQQHLRCTAHVFKAYPDQGIMTIAWYGAGVRVLDISGLAGPAGASVGTELTGSAPVGIREIGSFYFPSTATQKGSQTWAAKALEFDEDGSAYIFANDLDRGFEVFHFDATAPTSIDPGQWIAGVSAGAEKAVADAPDTAIGIVESETGEDIDGNGQTASINLPYCVIVSQDSQDSQDSLG